MKISVFLCCCLGLCALASSQVTMNLYEEDGVTPFDFRDIMVGTKLTVVVESSSAAAKCGGLFIEGDDRFWGRLSGRDRDPGSLSPNCNFNDGSPFGEPGDWTGSHFPSAGGSPTVYTFKDSSLGGFDTESDNDAVAGDWFILDYTAIGVEDPNGNASVEIGLYDYDVSIGTPIQTLTVSQVRTRDFNDTGIVDYVDFSIVNNNWMATNCQDPNWCGQTDLNRDGGVNIVDLGMFIDFWLAGI